MSWWKQARRQDLAAGGAKNQKEGRKNRRGGHIFIIQYWMYAATGWPKVKWGSPISNGGACTTGLPAGDGPGWKDSPCSSIMLLSFQKNSLHDYEENEPSNSYCTLIVRKNLTGVFKGLDI